MERNAAPGCSEIAQPNRSVLIGAMIVEPTERQISCQQNTLSHVYIVTVALIPFHNVPEECFT